MPAYVLADIQSIHDPETYAEYRRQVLATIERYGGRFLVRGGATEELEGEWRSDRVVVAEFPDMEAARRWYASLEYAPLILLRQRASNGRLLLVEGVESG